MIGFIHFWHFHLGWHSNGHWNFVFIGQSCSCFTKSSVTNMALMDNLTGINSIRILYTSTIDNVHLFIALGIFGFLLILNTLKIYKRKLIMMFLN